MDVLHAYAHLKVSACLELSVKEISSLDKLVGDLRWITRTALLCVGCEMYLGAPTILHEQYYYNFSSTGEKL